ncbi:MAG TPA: invasion associated locus B family protein [Azospirillaceae bacterium]|nr:invasion associated locus B family protein [Azospirillaceae bacterium]
MLFVALAVTVSGKAAYSADFSKSSADFGPEGTWANSCEVDRMTDLKVCRLMVFRLVEDGRDTGFVSLTVIPSGTDYHLFLTTSQGMIENCAVRIDRQPRIESQIATINMCMFPNAFSSKMLEQMKNGSTILVRVNFMRNGRRDVDFSLNGFSRNFDEMSRNLH